MTAAESWATVDAILARPPIERVAGQLAAFPVDVPTDPFTLDTVPHGAVQCALFDPEVLTR